jgi:uncharacterized protein
MTELNDEQRIEARDPIGGLQLLDEVGEVQRSTLYRYSFPEQEYSIKVDSNVNDPATMKSCGTVFAIDGARRTIDLKRGKGSQAPHPTSIVALDHVNSAVMRQSLLRVGDWVVEHGISAEGPYRAARSLLLREPPKLWAESPLAGAPLQHANEDGLESACRIGRSLVQSVLPIQGPPGAGKTFTGSHMIVELLRHGKKVGITANSHKVIGNLLDAVCKRATEQGVDLRAIQSAADNAGVDHAWVKQAKDSKAVGPELKSGDCNLAAGTAWLWSREDMQGTVDVLFVDEAGQMSLAYVVSVAPAAGSLVLLGDPLQLDQPLKGVHPPGAEASALGHLLGNHATIPPDRGLFLETTWRLHPSVCTFTSEAFYESKLEPQELLVRQNISTDLFDGPGLWIWPVEHEGNDTASEEEALVIARMAHELVDGPATWVNRYGEVSKIGWNEVLIVAPYNAQVGMIQRLLPLARVGTVDKFQGQEAPVSIYSMATSNPEDAPRGMSFLYSRNRLNVASSRARCATILVCSPNLLRVYARTPEQMRLANALCQFAEMARNVKNASADVKQIRAD